MMIFKLSIVQARKTLLHMYDTGGGGCTTRVESRNKQTIGESGGSAMGMIDVGCFSKNTLRQNFDRKSPYKPTLLWLL